MTSKVWRPMVAWFVLPMLCVSCAARSYEPTVECPNQTASEGDWYTYYSDQMQMHGDNTPRPNVTAPKAEKVGYSKALDEWSKKKLKQQAQTQDRKYALYIVGWLAGMSVLYLTYSSQY